MVGTMVDVDADTKDGSFALRNEAGYTGPNLSHDPPSYQDSSSSKAAAPSASISAADLDSYPALPPYTPHAPPSPEHLLPPTILGLYHTGRRDYFIAAHAKEQPSLFFAAAVRGMVKPHITLHPGSDTLHRPIASAKFCDDGLAIDLNPKEDYMMGPEGVQWMYERGLLHTVRYFAIDTLPGEEMERFEWRKSHSDVVHALKGKSSGLECIRLSTGETTAVYAEVGAIAINKIGKFQILEAGRGLGDRWEKMVIMGLLSLVEQDRRESVAYYDTSNSVTYQGHSKGIHPQ